MPSEGGIKTIVLSTITTTLAWLALGLRIWSRRHLKVRLAFSDYAAIAASILVSATNALGISIAAVGATGSHVTDLQASNPEALHYFMMANIPGQLLWAASNTCVKITILSLYVELFPNKIFHYTCYTIMGVSGIYLTSVIVEGFVLCTPVQFNWDKSIPSGECHNQNMAYLAAGIMNLIIDVIIVALPMPQLFGLNIPMAKKLGIAAMFGLGSFICIVTLLRVIAINNWDLTDITYYYTPVTIYSLLEPNFGMVNACLPTVRPAFQKLFPKVFSTQMSGSRSENQQPKKSSTRDTQRHHFNAGIYHSDFERLEDDIPLTRIRGDQYHDAAEGNVAGGIVISREWVISDASGQNNERQNRRKEYEV